MFGVSFREIAVDTEGGASFRPILGDTPLCLPYDENLRLASPTSPANPLPNSHTAAGTGTVERVA